MKATETNGSKLKRKCFKNLVSFGASSFYWRVMDRPRTIHSRAPRYSFSLNAHPRHFLSKSSLKWKIWTFSFLTPTFFTLSSRVTGNFTYNLLLPLHDLFLRTTVSTVHCTNNTKRCYGHEQVLVRYQTKHSHRFDYILMTYSHRTIKTRNEKVNTKKNTARIEVLFIYSATTRTE